ncbi:MAG: hypothetical protein IJK04_16365, partial [Kiritimatiellae bacterium]|nr:hypothetical protein [Kiritimatiellia bacterium]
CPHAEEETKVTIIPPARKTYGDTTNANATVYVRYYTGRETPGANVAGYSIKYYKATESGGVYTQGEKLNGAPTDAGTYLAVLTAPDRTTTASVGYTISRRPENAPSVEEATNACGINYTAETATPTVGYEVSAVSSAETEATSPLSLTDILNAEGTPTVYVRKVASDSNHAPSEWVEVTLAPRPDAPTSLDSTNATNGSSQNGTITDVTDAMEYSASGVDWTDVSSTSITGLNPGEYSVRVKATDSAPHGVAATVTVGSDYVALTDQNKPTITVPGSHTAPVVDDELTASCNATDIAYQWYRGDTPIEGATSAAYTVTADDVGYTIKVVAMQMTDADGKDYGEMQRPAQTSEATEAVVKKAGPAAPAITDTGFTPDYRAETFTVNEAYEVYSSNDETGAEITSLTAALDGSGKVYIRARETADAQAGAWLVVTLASRPAAPTGLTTANATNASTDDGQIIGTTASMEYKQAGSKGEWTTATVTQTLVTPGTYLVRARATDSAPHGVAATVTVGSWQIILSDAQKPKARDLTYTGAP